jgi:hypothetical protein
MTSLVKQPSAAITPMTMPPGMIVNSLADAIQIGKILAASRFFKDATNEQQAVAKILRGWELGIPPVAALENISVIDGRTTLSAHLIAAKVAESSRYRLFIVNHTHEECVVRFEQKVDGNWEYLGVSEFTIDDARRASLLHKKNWQTYPKAMLYARAVVQGARWYCSSVFMGSIYIPEELEATTIEARQVEEIPVMQSNSEQISNLLNQLGVTDSTARKTVATQYLGGRKAADLTPDELEAVLNAIRQAYAQEAAEEDIETVEAVETIMIDDDGDNEPVETPEAPEPTADEPTDARAAISAALDRAGITDVDQRQATVKKQLLAIRRRKVDTLTPEEVTTVIKGIAAAA